ncbi:MAG: hypothetical protein LBE56_11220 [Tannerella sp.]|jgi:hypothetical protein|nr:hypothetical protein [Tannerella sp.]
MNKSQFKSILDESFNDPTTIQGIYNWCDRWCERCNRTAQCTVYKASAHLPEDKPEDFFKLLSEILEATMEMLIEYAETNGLDYESLKDTDFQDEYERNQNLVRNDAGVIIAKQYGKQVKQWFESLQTKDATGMKIRLKDPIMKDCLEVIQWYQYFLEIKMARALMSQKDEHELEFEPYYSLGTAKLLLVSIERNIGAWGYIYQKFREDEDIILDMLVNLQRLYKLIEQLFPSARAFIRPGLDETDQDIN